MDETGSPRSVGDQPEPVDVEAVLGAHPLQERHVALAAVTEVEVVADDDRLGPQAADQHLGDEVLGRLLATAAWSKWMTRV